MKSSLLNSDFEQIYTDLKKDIRELKDKKLFLTGGTGFFGIWILEFIHWANSTKKLNLKVKVLSRNPQGFIEKFPYLKNEHIDFVQGDLAKADIIQNKLNVEPYNYFIHAGADVNKEKTKISQQNKEDFTRGTESILDFASKCGCKRFLFISSGAIYGENKTITPVVENEDFEKKLTGAYSQGKYYSEKVLLEAQKSISFNILGARCFSFIGPYVPQNGTFVAGDFIKNALQNEDIVIHSDGSSIRSYMYMSDLVTWLFSILLRGESGEFYNVGSDEAISIKDLSEIFRKNNSLKVIINSESSQKSSYYVPNINKCKEKLNLKLNYNNKSAVLKTLNYYKGASGNE